MHICSVVFLDVFFFFLISIIVNRIKAEACKRVEVLHHGHRRLQLAVICLLLLSDTDLFVA